MTVPGRLGADPELRATARGTSVANFRVAVDGYDREKKEKTTTWVRVTMWGDRGEQLAKLLSKGDAVCFMGTGELKSYDGKNGEVWYIECTASECALMGSGKNQRDEGKSQQSRSGSQRGGSDRGKRGDSEQEEEFPADW
jgi:single-strand DNA-binding protein